MNDKAPAGTRVLADSTDWESLTPEQVIAVRDQVNRKRSSRLARIITGLPDRGARTEERVLELPGRRIGLRVHRPRTAGGRLPLILSFHGGAFVLGTPAQNDWLNSFLAAELGAMVVSVDYRLAPEHRLPDPVEDGYDTLVRIADDSRQWNIDPGAVAVLGESAGGTIAALVALRARQLGPALNAQVLTCPVTDWTSTMTDYPSVAANAGNPGLSLPLLRTARRLSTPADLDPLSVSPLKKDRLEGVAPALVVTATLDPVADHGERYVERLTAAGVDARLSRHCRAVHAFLSVPGVVPAARQARREVLNFLTGHLQATPQITRARHR